MQRQESAISAPCVLEVMEPRLLLSSSTEAAPAGALPSLDSIANLACVRAAMDEGSADPAGAASGVVGIQTFEEVFADPSPAEARAFRRLKPYGGLMAVSRGNTGLIEAPGGEEEFTFHAQAEQTIAAAAWPDDPAATLAIELVGLSGPVSALAPGEAAVLAPQPIAAGGTYTMRVSGDAAGSFRLEIGRNCAMEVFDTADGDGLAIDDSLVALDSGRFGAAGTSELTAIGRAVWGVQPATGQILLLDADTGGVRHSFPAPDALAPGHTHVGLSIAEGGDSLLYVNADVDPGTLYRLHPFSGAVLSVETTDGLAYDGLAFAPVGTVTKVLYSADMNTDPGWTLEGGWAYGVPTGGGSHNGDPTSGFTGDNVVGYNLDGDYDNFMRAFYATTPAIDASACSTVTLSFQRWLGVEDATFDHAGIEVSSDGVNWSTVWEHAGSAIADEAWAAQSFDISAVAAGQSTVYIRWSMGPTDNTITYPGWNLDDVLVTGQAPRVFLNDRGVEVRAANGFSQPESTHFDLLPPAGGLGGDGTSRQFAFVPGAGIVEHDAAAANTVVNLLPAPADDVEGLAFDGAVLYASTASGELFSLDPDDGAVLDLAFVPGGALFGLGASDEAGMLLPDVDVYTVELQAGLPANVILAGQRGAPFAGEQLQLLDTDGATVLAEAVPDPLAPGQPAGNYDLAILDYAVPADGTYTVRLVSLTAGDYGLMVTEGIVFETEPNDALSDPLVGLDGVGTAAGYLTGGTELLFAVESGSPATIHTIDPATGYVINSFASPEAVPTNPFRFNLAFDGERLYYNASSPVARNTIYLLDAEDGALLGSFVAEASASVLGLGYVGGELFVMDDTEADIDVYDAGTLEPVRSMAAPVNSLTGFSGDDANDVLYGVDQIANELLRMDPLTGEVLAAAPSGVVLEQGMAVVGDELFVSVITGFGPMGQLVVVYDAATMTETRRFNVPFESFIGGLGGDGVRAGFLPDGSGSAYPHMDVQPDDSTVVQFPQGTAQEKLTASPAMQSLVIHPMVAEVERRIVVADDPALHEVPTNAGLDGVVSLIIERADLGGYVLASGSLLMSGWHILTAGHAVTDDFGEPAAGTIDVTFELPSGTVTVPAASYSVHPDFDGNSLHGYDVALIELPAPAPAEADRYDIYRGGDEVGEVHQKVGYGRSGTGETGDVLPSGIKRDGENVYDALADVFDGYFFEAGTITPGSQLAFDFDSGLVENDAFDNFFGLSDTGLGDLEVTSAPGDSGGPTFIGGLIAGVTSYGFGLSGLPDALPGTNSSFGEFAIDMRVSFVQDWIDAMAVDPTLLGPSIVAIDPPAGLNNNLGITEVTIEFSEPVTAASAADAGNYLLIEAGADGLFEGGAGDDVVIGLTPSFDGDRQVVLAIGAAHSPLVIGSYQLTIDGSDAGIVDADGNPLNTRTGPGGGADEVHEFQVVFLPEAGGDLYTVTLGAGDQVTVTTTTPFDDALGTPLNDLDPKLLVIGPSGAPLLSDADSASDGKNAELSFVAMDSGVYTVQVIAESGAGEYVLNVVAAPAPSLEIVAITVNDGDEQRSNIEKIAIEFSHDANIQELIDSGAVVEAIELFGELQVPLTADRFQYDSESYVLTIDLTTDGFGGEEFTLLADGEYELRLHVGLITAAGNPANHLVDDDGIDDGVRRFSFHRLEGDFDGSGSLSLCDLGLFFPHLFSREGSERYDVAFDLDGNGRINCRDIGQWIRLYVHSRWPGCRPH